MKIPIRIYSILFLISVMGVASFNTIFQPDLTIKPVYAQKTYELAQQNKQAEQPLIVIAYLQVKPEHRQTFLDLATNVVKLTNETEPGANSYTFYESPDTPNLFFFFEDWQNEVAFEEHLQKTHTKSLTEKYPEILAESADVRIYKIEDIEKKQVP